MADAPHVQYEVTHQTMAPEPDAQGQFHDTYTVHFRTPSGTHSHVKMRRTHYTPGNVHAAIQQEATMIEAVHGLPATQHQQAQ